MGGHNDFLLNCNIGAKAYSRSCTYSNEIFTGAFAGNFYKQMVAFIQNEACKFSECKLVNLSIQ